MKFLSRRVVALALCAVISLQVVPVVNAAPRDRDGVPARIVHLIKKLQKLFGIVAHDEQPNPPKP